MDEFLIKEFTNDEINYPLHKFQFSEKILYIAPVEFRKNDPTYMADALGFFKGVDYISGITAKILVERDNYIRKTYDSISLYLGLLLGSGITILGYLLHNLLTKKRKYYDQEDIFISFKYVDIKGGKSFEYSGLYSGLKTIPTKIYKDNPDIGQEILEYIEKLDTGFADTTNFCKNQLKGELFKIIPLEINNLKNFLTILQFLVNTMHLDTNEYNFLNKSADDFWEEHKDDNKLNFETNWFQPKIYEILGRQFGEDVNKEVDEVRGFTDFLLYNIPIECKVITDRTKYREEMSGLEILEKYKSQSFQETIHSRCGFLIAYDYRKKKVKAKHKKSAIVERIQFKIQGHKLIVLLVFLGNLNKPSQ